MESRFTVKAVDMSGTIDDESTFHGCYTVKADAIRSVDCLCKVKAASAIVTNFMLVGEGKIMILAGSVDVSCCTGKLSASVSCEFSSGFAPGTKGGVVGGGHV